eukprot:TRINITY_DN5702_c0_g2_i1.p1 TRINITY_DN5702_c0_g2~~TRINITY_DN5702_c0_g2_i1.p1  ORF type:complete len:1670 (+),score=327.99 TRINITY_DN5702_c0_g2_i1:523-5532(+)
MSLAPQTPTLTFPFAVGDRVEFRAGNGAVRFLKRWKAGTVRYIEDRSIQPNCLYFVGVESDTPDFESDGEHRTGARARRYFQSPPKTAVFLFVSPPFDIKIRKLSNPQASLPPLFSSSSSSSSVSPSTPPRASSDSGFSFQASTGVWAPSEALVRSTINPPPPVRPSFAKVSAAPPPQRVEFTFSTPSAEALVRPSINSAPPVPPSFGEVSAPPPQRAEFTFSTPSSLTWSTQLSQAPRIVPLDPPTTAPSTSSIPLSLQGSNLSTPEFGSASSTAATTTATTPSATEALTSAFGAFSFSAPPNKRVKLTSSSASPFPSLSGSSSSSTSSPTSTSPFAAPAVDPPAPARHKYKVSRHPETAAKPFEATPSDNPFASSTAWFAVKAKNRDELFKYLDTDTDVQADFERLDLEPAHAIKYASKLQKVLSQSRKMRLLLLIGNYEPQTLKMVLNDLVSPATLVQDLLLHGLTHPQCLSTLVNAIANPGICHIHRLSLRELTCTPDDILQLANAIQYHSHLQGLYFVKVKLGLASLEAICRAINSPRSHVNHLILKDSEIGDDAAPAILRMLQDKRCKLLHLQINGNTMSDQMILDLVQAACRGGVIKTFTARRNGTQNNIKHEVAVKIALAAADATTLTALDLNLSDSIQDFVHQRLAGNLQKDDSSPILGLKTLCANMQTALQRLPEVSMVSRCNQLAAAIQNFASVVPGLLQASPSDTVLQEALKTQESLMEGFSKIQEALGRPGGSSDESISDRQQQREKLILQLHETNSLIENQLSTSSGGESEAAESAKIDSLNSQLSLLLGSSAILPAHQQPPKIESFTPILGKIQHWAPKLEHCHKTVTDLLAGIPKMISSFEGALAEIEDVISSMRVATEAEDAAKYAHQVLLQREAKQNEEKRAILQLRDLQSSKLQELKEDHELSKSIDELRKDLTEVDQKLKRDKRRRAVAEAEIRHFESEKPSSSDELADFEKAKAEFAELNSQVDAATRRKNEILAKLRLAVRGCPELPAMYPEAFSPEIQGQVLADKTKSSFLSIEPLPGGRGNVYLAKDHNGDEWILKRFSLDPSRAQELTATTRSFGSLSRELSILQKLRHPLIAEVVCVFKDGPDYFLQMPRYRHGTLKEWLSPPSPQPKPDIEAKKRVLFLILQALSFVHRSGIIHRDIKLENILMKSESHPVISDFDISRDDNTSSGGGAGGVQSMTLSSTSALGTFEYLAPEILSGAAKSSAASDIYAFGVVVFKAFSAPSHPLPPLMPSQDVPVLPSFFDANLVDLLSKLLHKNPSERPSAEEVLVHPLFHSTSSRSEEVSSSSGRRIAAFRAFTQQLQNRPAGAVTTTLRCQRNAVASTVSQLGTSLPGLCNFKVEFVGEAGIDGGGLTSAFYRLAFEQVVLPATGVLEREESSSVYIPRRNLTTNERSILTGLGYLVARSIVEQRPVDIRLGSYIYKYMVGKDPSWDDLHSTLPSMARQLQNLVACRGVEAMELDFSEFSDSDTRKVTEANKLEYVKLKIISLLVDSRRDGLDAIKRGFFSIQQVKTQLEFLTSQDIQVLLCGNEYISPDVIIQELVFQSFSADSSTPNDLKAFLRSCSSDDLKKFITFVTEYTNVPAGGLYCDRTRRRGIIVSCCPTSENLPSVSTCFFTLKLPDYRDPAKLAQKLLLAMEEQTYLFS